MGKRFGLSRSIHVHRHHNVSLRAAHVAEREGIQESAVHQRASVFLERMEHHRDGDGRADRIEQVPRLEHHLTFVGQVGGEGRIRQRKRFDAYVRHNLSQLVHKPVAFHHAFAVRTHVGKIKQLSPVPAAHPLLAFLQFPGGIHGSDHGTHRCARDGRDLISPFQKFLDDPDVGDSPGSPHGEHQCDFLSVHIL